MRSKKSFWLPAPAEESAEALRWRWPAKATPWWSHGSTDSAPLDSAYEEVKQLSPASIRVVAELSNSAAIREMFDVIRGTFGRLDALVNNAATQNPSPITGA